MPGDDASVELDQLLPLVSIQLDPEALLRLPAEPATAAESGYGRYQEGLLTRHRPTSPKVMGEVCLDVDPGTIGQVDADQAIRVVVAI